MNMKKKKLRSGYTTGACAAAAAKAAVSLLLRAEALKRGSAEGFRVVDIPFPDGSRHKFSVVNSRLITINYQLISSASVIKDAGDDPDITHGAEITATAKILQKRGSRGERPFARSSEEQDDCRGEVTSPLPIVIKGGKGVGTVTKPGLSVPVGGPAINPVPGKMIEKAVREGAEAEDFQASGHPDFRAIEITISVPNGEKLAEKTLNSRLGIEGGISILGTTGIVRPVSADAWTATISSSMDVAKATGKKEIVLSAGRASEKAHMKKYHLPEEAYVLMGDHLEFSLREAAAHGFEKVHLCAQWAKMVKIAMATPQTHVRFGAMDIKKAAGFLNSLKIDVPQDREFNTAREIFDHIQSSGADVPALLQRVCGAARVYAGGIAKGAKVIAHLVSYTGEITADSE